MSDFQQISFCEGEAKLLVPVGPGCGDVWLTCRQMAELFGCDAQTIDKKIRSISEEAPDLATAATCCPARLEGGRKGAQEEESYHLDMILAVGYRVSPARAAQFLRWVADALPRVDGRPAVGSASEQEGNGLDSAPIADVVQRYARALDLLDDYDHQHLQKPRGYSESYVLGYEECRRLIDAMGYGDSSAVFGNEKDDSFKGSLGNIYQSFAGKELYPSTQEKAANLLYMVTKNHAFSDGNKRIAAAVFLYFLQKNNLLYRKGEKVIADHALVAMVVMIAESRPEEKETMVRLVMNFLAE